MTSLKLGSSRACEFILKFSVILLWNPVPERATTINPSTKNHAEYSSEQLIAQMQYSFHKAILSQRHQIKKSYLAKQSQITDKYIIYSKEWSHTTWKKKSEITERL